MNERKRERERETERKTENDVGLTDRLTVGWIES